MTRFRLGLLLLLASAARPALADPRPDLNARVDRVERELKAVQRKVFPGGAPAYSEPEIAAPAPDAAPAGTPASAPLNDLTQRVNDLERSVQQMTGRVEEVEHRLTLLSEQSAKDRQEFDTRLKALEPAAAAAPPPGAPLAAAPLPPPAGDASAASPFRPSRSGRPPASGGTVLPPPPPADDAASSEAGAPSSGDPAENGYMAGYRAWQAKRYGEAESTLKGVVAKYPKSRRASYAQNLLGRAYLDDGQPARAAEAFAANYQTNPRGERAPDSLYYLGQSLQQLKKNADACRVYGELDAAYGSTLSDSLKARVATARRDAKCAK